MNKSVRRDLIGSTLLAAAMWVTRSHQIDDHFGSLAQLPDTSWAVFFIAGLIGARWWAPTLLIVNAGVIDYLALLGGVSDYCLTPAYPFLIPTYLALWASGRWVAFEAATPVRTILRTALALMLGVSGAFIISNASFYALAGYFGSMTAFEYASAVLRYLPHFMEGSAIYTAVAVLILFVRAGLAGSIARSPAAR